MYNILLSGCIVEFYVLGLGFGDKLTFTPLQLTLQVCWGRGVAYNPSIWELVGGEDEAGELKWKDTWIHNEICLMK